MCTKYKSVNGKGMAIVLGTTQLIARFYQKVWNNIRIYWNFLSVEFRCLKFLTLCPEKLLIFRQTKHTRRQTFLKTIDKRHGLCVLIGVSVAERGPANDRVTVMFSQLCSRNVKAF